MKILSFKVNLRLKWVVGLLALIALGLYGVCPTRPNASFFRI